MKWIITGAAGFIGCNSTVALVFTKFMALVSVLSVLDRGMGAQSIKLIGAVGLLLNCSK